MIVHNILIDYENIYQKLPQIDSQLEFSYSLINFYSTEIKRCILYIKVKFDNRLMRTEL